MDEFESFFDEIRKYHDIIGGQMEKLRLDPCMDVPKVGDTVILCAGPLGMGHNWDRLEARVLCVANNSYKVRIFGRLKFVYPEGYVDKWIDPVLVLDIISQEQNDETK